MPAMPHQLHPLVSLRAFPARGAVLRSLCSRRSARYGGGTLSLLTLRLNFSSLFPSQSTTLKNVY